MLGALHNRDKNFTAVGTTLSRKAKVISAQYEERHEAKTVSELKQFVAKLPQMQATKQSLALRKCIFFSNEYIRKRIKK